MPSITSSSAPSTSILITSGLGTEPAASSSSIEVTATSIRSRASLGTEMWARREKAETSEMIRLAEPELRAIAVWCSSTHSMPFSARLSRIAATFSGTGSNATTRPLGPTMEAAISVTKPTFAPTSKNVIPGASSRRSASCSGRSAVPVAKATAEPCRLMRSPRPGPLRIGTGLQRSVCDARRQTVRTSGFVCCAAAILFGRRRSISHDSSRSDPAASRDTIRHPDRARALVMWPP